MSYTATKATKKDLRQFAWIWFGFLTIIGLFPLISGKDPILWVLGLGVLFAAVGLLLPVALTPIHKVWMAFGHYAGLINSKIIMFILFFGIFTPIAMVLRIFGKDLLGKKPAGDGNTYWKSRAHQPSSMKNQF